VPERDSRNSRTRDGAVTRLESSEKAPTSLASEAGVLAELHALSDQKPGSISSLIGLSDMAEWLRDAHTILPGQPGVAKATEWLMDNAYVVERAVRQVRGDLPAGYYRRLPALAIDDESRPPRVYALAHGIVSATSLQLTAESISRFVSAYQRVEMLDLAELWALPTMLRLTCIEVLVSSLERLSPELPAPFEITQIRRVPLRLDDTECVARSVRGLAMLNAISWPEFIERTSAIDAVLEHDPAAAYAKMDPQTRDQYRRSVEDLARRSHHDERDVARRALTLARRSANKSRSSHVGFWLVAEGRKRLELSLRYKTGWMERGRRGLRRYATGVYLGGLFILTAGFMLIPGLYFARAEASLLTWGVALALLSLPASMLAVTLLRWMISRLLPPTVLPKLDFGNGIPGSFKTAVTIPSLLGNAEDAEGLLRQIERHRLSNPDPNLEFVLLTGFPEADESRRPEDAVALDRIVRGIAELNRRHDPDGPGPFHLLHRERRFNTVEGLWMGWERKRGKLDEFNRLLLGEEVASFEVREGDASGFDGIRFVITLDSDTDLPQGTAARLIGTLAHPLNRAGTDSASGRVLTGYTVIQPRVETSPESGNRSLFTQLYCGDTAIDIYSRAVSDVYQDLFGTGIYIGKAIYDLAAFSQSLVGRVPENALASHDLFEGVHGRAALATDIVLYEDYPPSYLAFARRLHRWIRGDWQLIPWLRRSVPSANFDYLPNRFGWIDRWKIIDNLRRSLLPPALFLLIVSGWTWLPGSPLVWTLFAILAPTGHLFIDFASGLVRERWRFSKDFSHSFSDGVRRWLLLFVFLPHQAAVTADATLRTLVRVLITKRHLLEWTTAANTAASVGRRNPVLISWTEMAVAPLAAVAIGAVLIRLRPGALVIAAPFLILWFASPEIARRISRGRPTRREQLAENDISFLHEIARRTWLFFESFVGPDGNWLPPDNYQEDPGRVVAHRTSPTNIGMLLLSTLVAYDLGYIGPEQIALRLRNTLKTVARLVHYRGHLLNWYHTRTLEPLQPRYVSTVDSGNLAAALFVIQTGCSEMLNEPCLRSQRWQGLADTIVLLRDNVAGLLQGGDAPHTVEFEKHLTQMYELVLDTRKKPGEWATTLQAVETQCAELDGILLRTATDRRHAVDVATLHEVRLWLTRVHDHIRGMLHEIDSLAPWLNVLAATPLLPEHHAFASELAQTRTKLTDLLAPSIPLARLAVHCEKALSIVAEARKRLRVLEAEDDVSRAVAEWLDDIEKAVAAGAASTKQLEGDLAQLSAHVEREALGMDFGMLYDPQVRHFFIGYNVTADEIDSHHYDLLASEARLASFVAIAKGDVPSEHWFSLDRPLTHTEGRVALLSWGGTMFEYLMPPLLTHSYSGTLLAESQRAAVIEQMADGQRRRIPWGVSESGFAAFDADHNYQYRAFGVQGLGRKRGLDDDLVVAPYASALALPLFPTAATQNLKRLRDLGMLGSYGFYEAIDFTPSRLPEGRDQAIVASHMSHHQGMILVAIDNLLCGDALVRRFESNARVQSTDLLLQERVPGKPPIEASQASTPRVEPPPSERTVALVPWRPDPTNAPPNVHLLGNGRLASRVTEAGSGMLRWREHALTRDLPDGTLDASGLWIYIRDCDTETTWSVGRQPIGNDSAAVDVVFHAHMVELHRRQYGIAIRADISIGAADDIEVRRITVVNETDRPRSLSFTSYGEVVLAPPREDLRHLAFSKLFVEGKHVPALDALVFTRRSRDPDEHFPVLMHRIVAESPAFAPAGFETDRERFLGRNGSMRRPLGLAEGLSGSQGTTLDPILALQTKVNLAPFAIEEFAFVTIAGSSRKSVDETAARYQTLASFEWLLADAHAEAEREAGRLGLEAAQYPEFQALLSTLLASQSELRATPLQTAANRLGQQDLWALGISGDHPMLLLRTANAGQGGLLGDLVRAHQFWRKRGTSIDLVVLSREATSYRDDVWEDVGRLLEEAGVAEWLGRPAGIHLVRADQISQEQRMLVETSAAAVLDDDHGALREQLTAHEIEPRPLPRMEPVRPTSRFDSAPALARPTDLLFDNGLGGFSPDGREYVIHLGPGQTTPAPWCNVLANDHFGSLVTEAGGGYTWAGNSGEFRLTPWTNDPVLDAAGESLYLRDEETTEVWSPTPGPAGSNLTCQLRHGAGYTEWRQNGRGLECDVRIFVPPDDPVKVVELHVRNHDDTPRRITATYYARLLLGRVPEQGVSHVVVSYDAPTRSLYAHNTWNADFSDQVVFLTSDREPHGLTANRTEFLGRDGDVRAPAALGRIGLSGTVGADMDPCAALQIHLDIGPHEEIHSHFILGAGRDADHATELARRWQEPTHVDVGFNRLMAYWDTLLSAVTIQTPEPAMDLLINRWALYQTLASRILARTGFYQSSGAFGFRDQLQDVLALLHCDPSRTRSHLLECASRQFEEGDVLHWWHPPLGRGVRTRCSDDLLWLPYATARYIEATGDTTVLDEEVSFLSAPPLGEEENERYDLFRHGDTRASLFEHCRRALDRGLTRGAHGLPLIGASDWNDGMNRVGAHGRGESIWLGWLAGTSAKDFGSMCQDRGDFETAKIWHERAQAIFAAVNADGWDGAWYRRAFDDDGLPWGSASSEECRIDSIAQSWSVLSGGAPPERAAHALRSAESMLIREDEQIACLLWPPFDITARDPGYIKAYPPGIRENGGQYSHAASWLGWAFAQIGDGDRAMRVFRMLNPIERTKDGKALRQYRLEPYSIAADIASVEPYVGRGGWSWYTGAAGWTWRLGVEAILGLRRMGDRLQIEPHIPNSWPGFQATVRTEGGVLKIVVENKQGSRGAAFEILVDGSRIPGNLVDLPTNGATRRVMVRTGTHKDPRPNAEP
jgi:cyclic beta-1,2-glucan synthetase